MYILYTFKKTLNICMSSCTSNHEYSWTILQIEFGPHSDKINEIRQRSAGGPG